MGYRKGEIQRVLDGTNETEPVRIKVTGPQGMTNWFLATKAELVEIQRILSKNDR